MYYDEKEINEVIRCCFDEQRIGEDSPKQRLKKILKRIYNDAFSKFLKKIN